MVNRQKKASDCLCQESVRVARGQARASCVRGRVPFDGCPEPNRLGANQQLVRGMIGTATVPGGKWFEVSRASSDDLVDGVLNDPACACLFQARHDFAYDRLFHNRVHVDPVRIGQRGDRWFLQGWE